MSYLKQLPERYRIDEMLGRRALARAFRATDLLTGDTLVLKSVRYPAWFSDKERSFHQRRAALSLQAAAKARHPHCASVYTVGEADTTLFVAREWVDGRPLSAILRESGSLPPSEVARIARQCSGALDALADSDLMHGSLTADNLILDENGSVRVTDARFSAEATRFDFAGASCDLLDRPLHGSDISALAEILLAAIDGLHGAARENHTAKRMVSALRRAQRDSRAYASAASLADALTSLSSAQIVRQVWRPATTTGLLAAFGTVCVFALSDEKPVKRTPSHPTPAIAAAKSAPVEPAGPSLAALTADDRSLLGLLIRRQGVAALDRPAVAEMFQLDAVQRAKLRTLLQDQRDQLAKMVEQAAEAETIREGAALKTQSVRQQATERALDVLSPVQRDLWKSLAGQEPAPGMPVL